MDFMSGLPIRLPHCTTLCGKGEPYWIVPVESCQLEKLCLSIIFALCSSENYARKSEIVRIFLDHCSFNHLHEDERGLLTFVENFNPFLNVIEVYVNQKLQREIKHFLDSITEEKKMGLSFSELAKNDIILEDVYNQVFQSSPFTNALSELYLFLRVIASVLKCQIIVSCEETTADWNCDSSAGQIYMHSTIQDSEAEMGSVQLFLKSSKVLGAIWLLYQLTGETGNLLQEKALTHILKMAGIPGYQKPDSILCHLQESRNILISLFREGHLNYVQEILKLPELIIKQLHMADLNISSECKNAFRKVGQFLKNNYFKIRVSDIIFATYNFCVPTWREYKSVQDKEFVMKFHAQVERILCSTIEFFQSPEQFEELGDFRIPLEEIREYHRLQRDIYSEMVKVCETEQSIEASRVKVETIMNLYKFNFHMNNDSESSHREGADSFNHYKIYWNFFKSLDYHVASLFFDNSLIAKHSMDPSKIENLESKFLKFLFLWYYCNDSAQGIAGKPLRHQDNNALALIAYTERQEFYHHVENFNHKQNLSRVQSSSPVSELYSSPIDPAIIDEFLVHRAKHYLNFTLSNDLLKDFDKMSAIFTRALQVIGEVMTFQYPAQPSLMKALLLSALPLQLADDLRQIRISLSHEVLRKGIRVATSRLDIEESKKEYYQGMQKDFRMINSSFQHIFELQTLCLKMFYLQNAFKALKRNHYWLPSGMEFELEEMCREYQLHMKKTKESIDKWIIVHAGKLKKHIEFFIKQSQMITYVGWKNKDSTSRGKTMKKHAHIFSCIHLILKLIDQPNKCERELPVLLEEEINAIFKRLENLAKEDDVDTITKFINSSLSGLQNFTEVALDARSKSFPNQSSDSNKFLEYQKHSHIHKYRHKIVLHEICCWMKEEVLEKSPPEVKAHIKAKTELIKLCENKTQVGDSEKIAELKDSLLFRETDFFDKLREGNVQAMCRIKHSCEWFVDALENPECELRKKDLQYACRKFKLDEKEEMELRKLLNRSVPPCEIKSLEFLCNRLQKLNKYLITNIPGSDAFFSKKTEKDGIKRYLKEKLLNLYTTQTDMQAVVESLMFDCMNLTRESREDLVHLCEKTNYLFSGGNLRKIIAHGDTVFEAASAILDPCDLMIEIICKSLELVQDLQFINKMYELRDKEPEKYMYEEDFKDYIKLHPAYRGMDKYLGLLPLKNPCKKKLKSSTSRETSLVNLGASTSGQS